MTRAKAKLSRTYSSLTEDSAVSLLIEHYGEGIGGYYFWAEIPTALKAWWRGIENVPGHPAQMHYAWLNNPDGGPNGLGLNDAIRLSTRTAIELLKLDYSNPITLLDAGCGVGGSVLQLESFLRQQKVKPRSVHGISIVAGQIKVAVLRSRVLGASNCRFLVGDCLDLPYRLGSFDGVIAIETFCHVPPEDKLNLLEGLFRVLTRGGRVVIMDGYLARKLETSDQQHWLDIFRDGWTLPELVSPREMNDLARRSGFEIERSFSVTERVRPSVKKIYRRIWYVGKPLLQIYRLMKKLGRGSNILHVTGVHSPNAEAFIQAGLAQKELFDHDWLTYHVHVLRRPV